MSSETTIAELKELRALTADENGAQRVAWTDMWLKSREWFTSKLGDLPVEDHLDSAGNRWITLRGESEKALILGSHLDSVPNGGWLDGALGVMTALGILRDLARQYNNRPPVTIRLVDWADEEGARFGRSLLGSPALHPSKPTGFESTKTGFALKMRCEGAASRSTVFPKLRRNAKTRPPTSNCTSNRGRCWKV